MAGTGLKRLAKLYALVEQRNGLEVRAAAVALHDVEQVALTYAADRRLELIAARTALGGGSRIEALAAERTGAAYLAHGALLGRLREDLRSARDQAVHTHRASRVERRQLDGVVERAGTAERIEAGRREQGLADDRFLARREWTRERAREAEAEADLKVNGN